MNTVLTCYDRPDEWYQDTYICTECKHEFMIDNHYKGPRFCPCCGVKFDAICIHYGKDHGGRTETVFIEEKEENKDV